MSAQLAGISNADPAGFGTHTGIVIEKDGKLYLRHASSRKSTMQVVEEDLREYMKGKPGLIVYRPIEP